ncbi:hypothetical protein M0R45_014432 [Rubus argutus]|uniref:Rx N-terminal domain-containing protein n=1 Tax=Rubus argutus TaxID=59490 RepID=A0AAW1XMM2_RUBAR
MAELSIPLALMIAEKALSVFDRREKTSINVHDEVEKACDCLRKMQSYLRDSENNDEGTQLDQTRVKQIQTLAYEIEDALDKFMANISHHLHSNIISQKMHAVANYRTEKKAISEFSSSIKAIEDKIASIISRDSLFKPPSLRTSQMRDDLVHVHQVLEEDEVVGFEEPKEQLFKQLMEVDSRLSTILVVGPGGSGKTTVVKNVYESEIIQEFLIAMLGLMHRALIKQKKIRKKN